MSDRPFKSLDPIAFLLDTPLYEKFDFEGLDNWLVIDFLYLQQTYDVYCVGCNLKATFEILSSYRPDNLKRNPRMEKAAALHGIDTKTILAPSGVHMIRSRCTRNKNHAQYFSFYIEQKTDTELKSIPTTIQKIGQYPSYTDVHMASVKKYSSVLSKTKLGELVRAIGLASHDVGIGAYVYLRRIFEGLVEDAHTAAKSMPDWKEDKYSNSRMNDKILLLKGHLPSFLVEHSKIYSFLSKGVHELSEEECLKNFPTLKIGIELILDETLAKKQEAQKITEAKAALSRLSSS